VKWSRWLGTRFVWITACEAVELHYRSLFVLDYSPSNDWVLTDKRRLKRQRRRHQL